MVRRAIVSVVETEAVRKKREAEPKVRAKVNMLAFSLGGTKIKKLAGWRRMAKERKACRGDER